MHLDTRREIGERLGLTKPVPSGTFRSSAIPTLTVESGNRLSEPSTDTHKEATGRRKDHGPSCDETVMMLGRHGVARQGTAWRGLF